MVEKNKARYLQPDGGLSGCGCSSFYRGSESQGEAQELNALVDITS